MKEHFPVMFRIPPKKKINKFYKNYGCVWQSVLIKKLASTLIIATVINTITSIDKVSCSLKLFFMKITLPFFTACKHWAVGTISA